MQNEVNDLLTAAVEAARDYVRGLAKTLTEEIYQEEFGAGLAALSYTTTRVLAKTDS